MTCPCDNCISSLDEYVPRTKEGTSPGNKSMTVSCEKVTQLELQLSVQAQLFGPFIDALFALELSLQLGLVRGLKRNVSANLADAVSRIILNATTLREEGDDDGIQSSVGG